MSEQEIPIAPSIRMKLGTSAAVVVGVHTHVAPEAWISIETCMAGKGADGLKMATSSVGVHDVTPSDLDALAAFFADGAALLRKYADPVTVDLEDE